jgi:hypothetical protein
MDAPGYGYDRKMAPGILSCCGVKKDEPHEPECPVGAEENQAANFLAPVPNKDDLPESAEVGALCFVDSAVGVYTKTPQGWLPLCAPCPWCSKIVGPEQPLCDCPLPGSYR